VIGGGTGVREQSKAVEVRDGVAQDLPAVLRLLKTAKSTVGFLTDEAVEERLHKGTLLVAVRSGEIIGYLLYDLPANNVTIRQLVVASEARKSGAARALVEDLAQRYQSSRRGMSLKCRRDFDANDIWHRLGFSPRNEQRGRGKQDRVLTLWWQGFGQPDLFSLAREEDERPAAALDTNLLIGGSDGASVVVEQLLADWVRAEVMFGFVDHSLVEINGHEEGEVRRRHIQYATSFEELPYPLHVAERLYNAALAVLGTAAAPHLDDVLIACRAAAAGCRWLVTEDGPFRRACASALREVADIEVIPISQMVLAADQLVRGDLYHGRYLQGTDIEVREVHSDDLDEVARVFLDQRSGETLRRWRTHLHALATDVTHTHLHLFRDKGEPVALAAITVGELLDVPICRVRRGPAEPTLARQLLGWLRNKCVETGKRAVRITDDHPGQWIERRCGAEGFLPERQPIAVPIRGTSSIAGLADILGASPLKNVLDPAHAAALSRLAPSPLAAHSVESVFHPLIVTGAGLRTVRVPISLGYAIDLFDNTLSEGRLWGRDRSVALRREHVYFRTPTARSLFAGPARLLWQVTGAKRHGGGTVRGCSLLDETVVGDVDQLINRYSHLGVLSRNEIGAMARGGQVMALRFSHTTVFPRPVTLTEYREVMNELEPGTGMAHAGPQPVSERVFVHLATMAS
jgi:predicted GNAT superfamily acetyltransferase